LLFNLIFILSEKLRIIWGNWVFLCERMLAQKHPDRSLLKGYKININKKTAWISGCLL